MLSIEAISVSKRYNSNLLFHNFSFTFDKHNVYAIVGKNGTGKSTLSKILASFLVPSSGRVLYYLNEKNNVIPTNEAYRHINFVAPYADLIEEMDAKEMINYYKLLKQPIVDFELKDFFDIIHLPFNPKKKIYNYSSGMKQRLKLGLAFLFHSHIIFLDEPCSYIDHEGKKEVYLNLIKHYSFNRKIIISSNNKEEYSFSEKIINIEDYNP